jgi:hypothetical protein
MPKRETLKTFSCCLDIIIPILLLVMISCAYGRETEPSSEAVPARQPAAGEEASSGKRYLAVVPMTNSQYIALGFAGNF